MKVWHASLLVPAVAALLASCAPRLGAAVQVPQITVEQTALERLDPPGLGIPASATVSLKLRVRNPNPFGVRLSRVDGDFYLDGLKVTQVSAPGVDIAATGVSTVTVNVQVPLSNQNLGKFADLAVGKTVAYRLEGSFEVDAGALGKPTFGPYTLAQGVIKDAPILKAPEFRFRPELAKLTFGNDGIVLELGLEVHNPNVLGFRLEAPLELRVGGVAVAKASLSGTVGAKNAGVVYTRFQIDPLALPQALIQGRFSFSVAGSPVLIAPGITEKRFGLEVLTQGSAERR
ncbi:LEA14-like dessication related protein [Deinobacterium chartae]|uniref:LEA14-like dessication related protein n=1 Tax=Deinobacterium chartae TaxID=521158 RepID=A0A841HWM2_9DEIO|nr:LEA type 2 family protein [Deinobacterium chartae]MBB6097931.1 LEA14-like dessication related protein [Deinobacterium chartae]